MPVIAVIHLGRQARPSASRLGLSLSVVLLGMTLAALTGCGFSGSVTAMETPVALHGTVNGGQQPVSGSSVQLYAAGTSGPGSAAQPLLDDPVQSDSDGNFSIPATYHCPSPTAQVYVVASGGNPGLSAGDQQPGSEAHRHARRLQWSPCFKFHHGE